MSVERSTEPQPRTLSEGVYDEVARASTGAVIDGYSTSFGLACRLLGEPVRTRVRTIYALVRLADEVVDGPVAVRDAAQAARLLKALEEETYDAVSTGYSTNLVVHAFALTARECGIGPDLITPFFTSMRTDLSVRQHDDASLAEYVYGSAEVVGLMCLRAFLTGCSGAPGRDGEQASYGSYEELAAGARRLGAAFQKVNFVRDLAVDCEVLGRSYLPGVDPESFSNSDRDALLDDIDADLAAAAQAIPRLPASSRRAVAVAHALFAELSRRLRATPATRIRQERVRVPAPVKARVLAAAALRGRAPVPGEGAR